MARSTGFFANTNKAKHIWKRCQCVRADYERTMLLISDLITKVMTPGHRKIRSVTHFGADKIYERIISGPRGELRGRRKKPWLCAAERGRLCIVYTRTNLTGWCQIHGTG